MSLYSATSEHTTHFHQLQRGTSDRIRVLRVNERTGEPVEFDDIVKGYDLGDGEYAVVEPGELDAIAPGKSELLEVDGFVDLEEIAPIFFDRTYYLAPKGRPYAKVYELLRAALAEAGKAGIARFVMRAKQYLVAIRAGERVIALETLHWADEVRDAADELDLPRPAAPSTGEKRAARELIDAMTIPWKPADYRDTYEEKVRDLVSAKAEGGDVVVAEPAPEATEAGDLMAALRRSVEQAGGRSRATGKARRGGSRPKSADRRPKAPAASAGKARRTDKRRKRSPSAEALEEMSKQELYARAGRLNISGRSRMTRDDLLNAVKKAD
ncbi:Ku protein [Yinghuangia seranimata]|uniref:non-homologous end joining protein Ku n=1 Tax=Yinghuangia seranimata TaxID=408067 RepID=UPI0031BB8949